MNTTLTLTLDGEVTLDALARMTLGFRDLVLALSKEVSPKDSIQWLLDDLSFGSASASVRGEGSDPKAIESVVGAFSVVGHALAQDRVVPYSPRVRKQAQVLKEIINDKVTAIRFETAEDTAIVSASSDSETRRQTVIALGTVEGRIQTLTSRNALRFIMYDSLFDRPVSCYLNEDQRDLMRSVWDQHARVEGWITRDADTGRPLSVRQIRSIVAVDEAPRGSYLHARGKITPIEGALRPEDTVRRMRDA
jgi:hypothetical protein